MQMFHTRMFFMVKGRILLLASALMQISRCVIKITCITYVKLKLINKGLLVNTGKAMNYLCFRLSMQAVLFVGAWRRRRGRARLRPYCN